MADYGLQITGMKYGTERVLFDSRDVGSGTYQSAKGTLAFGSTFTCKISDMLMINLTRPSTGDANVIITATKSRNWDDITWTFYKQTIGSSSYNTGHSQITGVNYVVLKPKDSGGITGDNYTLQCSAYGGGITFDTRYFSSSEGEAQIDRTQAYSGNNGHGGRLAQGWNGADRTGSSGDDYYFAYPLEQSSWTGGTRNYGYLWTTISSANTDLGSNIFSSASSNGAVHSYNVINNPYAYPYWFYPSALAPTFAARPSLGSYDPE